MTTLYTCGCFAQHRHGGHRQAPFSGPSAWSPCSSTVGAPRSWGPLASSCCLGSISSCSLSQRGFILHFCVCFILNANRKVRGNGLEMGLAAFNTFPDAGLGFAISYKPFHHLGTGNTKPTATQPRDGPSPGHLLSTPVLYNKGCRSLLAFPTSRACRRKGQDLV